MNNYGYIALAIALTGVFGLLVWWCWRRAASGRPVELLDYVLLWPLIFSAERRSKKQTRRGFVFVGVVAGVALIAADMFINGRRHG